MRERPRLLLFVAAVLLAGGAAYLGWTWLSVDADVREADLLTAGGGPDGANRGPAAPRRATETPGPPPLKQAPAAPGPAPSETPAPEAPAPETAPSDPAAPTQPAPAAAATIPRSAPPVEGKEIVKAVDKGVAWLRKKQARDGSWGWIQPAGRYGTDQGHLPAGTTALALYALLSAKQSLKDPVVKRGFDYLYKKFQRPASSCEASMLLLALTATATSSAKKGRRPKISGRYRTWANKVAIWLIEKRAAQGWRYNDPEHPNLDGGEEDLSSTQLAALALLSARRVGIKVEDAVWEDIIDFTLRQQQREGPPVILEVPPVVVSGREAASRGFTYVDRIDVPDRGAPTGGMTACGIANLLMARDVLSDGGREWAAWGRRDDVQEVQRALRDGFAWLSVHWSPFENPGKGEQQVNHPYWLWMLECAMDLGHWTRLEGRPWYVLAGAELLARQRSDGSWQTEGGSWKPADVLDTAFAVLFLMRATHGLIRDI